MHANVLDQELEFFKAHRKEWLKHYEGQFALVKNQQLLGTYTTIDQAVKAGYSKVGNQPFLVKQMLETDEELQFPALALAR